MTTTLSKILVGLYKLWHGRLHLKGAGWLLRRAARWSKGLQHFQHPVPNVGNALLDFRDISAYAWLHYLQGESSQEDGLLAILRRFVTADSVYWDVGANVGIIATHVFTRCNPRSIYAIEPNPEAIKVLYSLFADAASVHIIEAALSDHNGTSDLFVPTADSSRGSLEGNHASLSTNRSYPVTCFRGDFLIQEKLAAAPHVVKIDVEGHEVAVLRGLQACIKQYRPVIVFEQLFLSDAAVQQLIPKGYSLFTVGSRSGELVPGLSRNVGHNCLLLPVGMR